MLLESEEGAPAASPPSQRGGGGRGARCLLGCGSRESIGVVLVGKDVGSWKVKPSRFLLETKARL